MEIIKTLFYGFITVFNIMPLKMFRRFCERYVSKNDESVKSVLKGYMLKNPLTYYCYLDMAEDVKGNLNKFFNGSKLEVIFQINHPKLWKLFIESVSERHLVLPEQFILVDKMPDEYFCQLYVNYGKKSKFFSRRIGLDLFNSFKELGKSSPYYNKLLWYVRYNKLSYSELKNFLDWFVDEAVDCGKTGSAEPVYGFCMLFREWMVTEGAERKDFRSHEEMLNFGLKELEFLKRKQEAEAKAMMYSGLMNYTTFNY